jgi:hypothetical protein
MNLKTSIRQSNRDSFAREGSQSIYRFSRTCSQIERRDYGTPTWRFHVAATINRTINREARDFGSMIRKHERVANVRAPDVINDDALQCRN